MSDPQDRLKRERRTIKVMIEIYCRGHHRSEETLCTECQALYAYGMRRIEKCPFQADKPTCAKCTVHCYKADMREQVRRVMRYSGPRMMIYCPFLAILHCKDQIAFKLKKN